MVTVLCDNHGIICITQKEREREGAEFLLIREDGKVFSTGYCFTLQNGVLRCVVSVPSLHTVHVSCAFGLWQNPLIFNNSAFPMHVLVILPDEFIRSCYGLTEITCAMNVARFLSYWVSFYQKQHLPSFPVTPKHRYSNTF